ncbi:MAG: substrate-binding periplasmic protein [Rheinheimera sp.]
MKYYISLVLMCWSLTSQASSELAPVTAATQPPALTLVVDNYPPYIDELAADHGMLSQLVQQAFTLAGVPTTLSFQPWPKVPAVATQAHHASFLWFKTHELEQNWLFSEPVVELRQMLISTNRFKADLHRFDELRPYRLGVTKGYFYGADFAAQRQDFRLTEAVSDYASLQNLLAGRVDMVLMDPIVAQLMWQQLPTKSLKLRFLPKPLLTAQPTYLVCSRNFLPCHAVIQSFNQGLRQLQQTGADLNILGFGVKK